MKMLRRPACLAAATALALLLPALAAASPAARATMRRAGPAGDPSGNAAPAATLLEARAAGEAGAVDDAAAALVDHAAAAPQEAESIAATLLLLDRNDQALDVLLGAGRHAQAMAVLASGMRVEEALALPAEGGGDDILRARLLILAGRQGEAADLLAGRQAWADAGRLGLRDAVLPQALDAAADPKALRAMVAGLWPGRQLEADVAWRWLRREQPAPTAAETLLRLKDMLDPAQPSKDADALLASGLAGMGTVTPCESPRLHAGLVGLAQSRGRADAALLLARAWASDEGGPAAWSTLADMLRNREDWAGAAAAYGNAAVSSPAEGSLSWLQGAMLRRAGDAEGALAAERLAETAATTPCTRLRLASAMDSTGEAAGAARVRETVLAGDSIDAATAVSTAAVLVRRPARAGGADSTLAALQRVRVQASRGELTIAKVLPIVRAAQAAELRLMARFGRAEEALALAGHAIDAFVLNADATADVAAALRAAGRDGEADDLVARVSEQVIASAEAFPESPRLLNARAWLSARTGRDLDTALQAASRAAGLAPDDAGILDTLAEVRFQRGDRDGALEAGRRALALEPERDYFRLQVERFTAGDPSGAPPVDAD